MSAIFGMRFRVLIKARNIWLEVSGTRRKVGFVTTRFTDAQSTFDAQRIVEAMVRSEFQELRLLNSSDDPFLLECIESERVSWFRGRFRKAKGFTFYTVDEEAL